ncbi:hybrid sensor histidine kinase/response regulator [Cohnella fermenti]|uniref:histidine kinase n=1 Tax=Cohnella fermenti TaxID=2565925 RepID=A0A4S4C9S7_9BACL|nr:ATP-binding protein [Cohnella fermenti]THF84151.1 response regulator [Cohnella fermenti]
MRNLLHNRRTIDRYQWILAAAVAAFLVIMALTMLPRSNAPQAVNGVLDLQGWNFSQQGNLPLDGEWEFYPNRLLEPADFASAKTEPEGRLQHVPGVWNASDMEAIGVGTYRLTVLLRPDLNEELAIQKQVIRFSDRFYVNGRLLGQSGIPAESRKDYKPGNSPYTIYFEAPADGKLEIVIQAANFEYHQGGGMYTSLTFGKIGDIVRDRQAQISLEWAGVIVLFIFGIFFIVLFGFFNRNKGFLFFGIFFAIFGTMIFLNGQRAFLEMVPNAPFQLLWKLKDVSLMITFPITILYTNSLLKMGRWKLPFYSISILYMIYTIAIVLLPYSVYSQLFEVFVSLLPICFILLFVMLLRRYRQQDYGHFDVREMQLFITAILCIVLFPINTLASVSDTSNILSKALTDGIVLLFIVLALMIVARRYLKLYSSMESLTSQLKRSDELKDEFLLQTSHELNTPLNGIINLSQSVLDDPARTPNAKRTREKLLLIRNMAFRMSNMVHDIIDLAQLKDERLVISKERVDLQACLSNLFSVYGFLASEKGVRLEADLAPDATMAWADERRLLQVLSNVLELSLRHTEHSCLLARARRNGEHEIVLTVESASGRRPSEQPLELEGIGIGLSIASELVRLMGGRLEWKEDPIGEGSFFEIALPAHKTANEPTYAEELLSVEALIASSSDEGVRGDQGRRGEDQKILIMAAPANLELLVNLLAIEGYRVETAHSASEALAAIRESSPPPDLLLLDVMMRDGESYELSRSIRRTHSPIDLPILSLIARNTPADIEAVLSAGGNDYIVKPLDAGEIRVRIRTLLAMKRLAKEAAESEMAFLQSQIKPHFLYNALGTIMSLCYTDGPRAGELLAVLSRYLRIIFHQDQRRGERVSLSQEIELVKAYADIEKARFGSRLELEIRIDETLLSVRVMPLTIQPLVENAIRHGVAKKVDGGTVKLTIERSGDRVRIEVEDNGIGMTADEVEKLLNGEEPDDGVGFRNIKRRVLHLSGQPPEVKSAPNVGTKVTLWLPASATIDQHGRGTG